jgi:tetratricopeptide (TPR) repeat protein
MIAAVVISMLAAASPGRHDVDLAAMQDAIAAVREPPQFTSSAAYAHFLAARMAMQEGDQRTEAEELRLALASDPGDAYLTCALAEAHAHLGDLPTARRLLNELTSRQPRDYGAQVLLGRVLLEQKQVGLARAHAKRAIRLSPHEPDAYLLLAQIGIDGHRPHEAEAAVGELWTQAGEAFGFKRLGLAMAERGDLPRAARLFQRAIAVDPTDAEAYAGLGQVQQATGDDARAEDSFSRALERDPDDREVLLDAGRTAMRQGAVGRAKAYFDRLLSFGDPDSPLKVAFSYLAGRQSAEAMRVLDEARRGNQAGARVPFYAGLLHERAGDFREAAVAFSEIPADAELSHEAALHRVHCLTRLGDPTQALAVVEAELVRRPDVPELLALKADLLFQQGKAAEAQAALESAIGRTGAPELYESLAELLAREDRPERALALLSSAAAQRPKDAALQFALGAAYQKAGKSEEAIAAMRRVLTLDQNNAAAMNFIGYLYAERGENLPEAERLAHKAVALQPKSGAFLDSLGWVLFREGRLREAVDALEKAVRLAPEEATIREHLGDAYSSAQRERDAAAEYRRALDALGAEEEALTRRESIERKLKFLSTSAQGR